MGDGVIYQNVFKVYHTYQHSGNYEIIQPDGSVKVEFVAGISLRNEFANALINQFDFIAAGQQQVSDMQLNLRESQLYN